MPPTLPSRAAALLLAAAAAAGAALPARAETVEYELVVAEEEVLLGGKPRLALTVNGSVPGPTLRFQVGDEAVVRVRNRLDTETSVHWHGVLLPNAEDGVPHLTTPPIPAGGEHVFRFPLTHPGTYWYHSHTGLQEQRGVYGSLVIAPAGGEPAPADREEVVVLSDWTDESPEEVMRTLMRGSDWYGIRKGTLPTVAGAWAAGRLGDYWKARWNRMPPMDVSDVAYDAFLANGRERLDLGGRPGERIRLRIINASASTNFLVHGSAGPLVIVAADGPAVEPLPVEGFLIAIAETYDVIVTVPPEGAREVRATAQDGSGHASVVIGAGTLLPAAPIPGPDLYTMDHLLAGAMESLGHGARGHAPAGGRPTSPYAGLRALVPSRAAEGAPVREIPLRLTGNMTRYTWSIDGRTLAEDSTIRIRRGEVLRITLSNDTMMHHPMHLHGHFFRVLDGDDERAPLKHTVDVPPMGRRVIEFDANESGDWFFHCHVLYHMDAGMARVFTYGPEDHEPRLDPAMRGSAWAFGEAMVLSNMSAGHLMVMDGPWDLGASWDVGYAHRDREHHRAEYEADAWLERHLGENLSVRAGGRLTNEMEAEDRFFGGIGVRLPLLARGRLEADTRGEFRGSLAFDVPIAGRLALALDGHYDTGTHAEGSAGLEFVLSKTFSLAVEAHSDHGIGAGITIRF